MVLSSAGTIINVIIGQTYAWSVLVNPLAQQFQWTPAEVSVAVANKQNAWCYLSCLVVRTRIVLAIWASGFHTERLDTFGPNIVHIECGE
jgi:hypothetical protein